MNKLNRHLLNEKGQGFVEYILVLVVVLTLAFLLANRFFKPFQKYAQFYIGDYIECLLDQGELPALGGQKGVKDCEFQSPFSADGAAGSKSSSGAKDSSSKDSKNKNSSNQGSLAHSGDGRQISRRVGGLDNDSGSKNSTITTEGSAASKSEGFVKITRIGSNQGSGKGKGARVTGLTGLLAAERDRIKKREDRIQKVGKISEEEGGGSRSGQKLEVKQKLRTKEGPEFEAGEFSFGKIFRLVLIILIVIALVLFLGGQLAQISKGMEK